MHSPTRRSFAPQWHWLAGYSRPEKNILPVKTVRWWWHLWHIAGGFSPPTHLKNMSLVKLGMNLPQVIRGENEQLFEINHHLVVVLQHPGDSSRNLFGMVKWLTPFQTTLATSSNRFCKPSKSHIASSSASSCITSPPLTSDDKMGEVAWHAIPPKKEIGPWTYPLDPMGRAGIYTIF